MRTWLIGLVAAALMPSAASAEWRGHVAAMEVDVDTTLPALCYIDRDALTSSIEEAYLEAGVAVSSNSAGKLASWKIPHRHTFLLTGTYGGGGFCFVAIATYITREHRVLDAPVPDGVFQDSAWQQVAYYSTSAFLIAE